MTRKAAIFALVPSAAVLGAFHSNRNFLGTDMRPDVVAHTLVRVENGWMKQATQFTHCGTAADEECSTFSQAFSKSCVQVVSGVVQGSNGERDRTAEYMADVCGQHALTGWHKDTCLSLRTALAEKMTESSFDNRESMDVAKICQVAWTSLVEEQKQVVTKERAERKEAEKREHEEAVKQEQKRKEEQKKAAEEAIKRAQSAEERAEAKEKEMEKEEEEKKKEEVKEKKTEDEKFQMTKQQIEAVERAADEKMEEATAVERDAVSVVRPEATAEASPAVVKVVVAPKAAAKASPAVVKAVAAPKPAAAQASHSAVSVPAASKPAAVAPTKFKQEKIAVAKADQPVVAKAVKAEKDAKPVVAKAPVAVKEAKTTQVKPAVVKPKA